MTLWREIKTAWTHLCTICSHTPPIKNSRMFWSYLFECAYISIWADLPDNGIYVKKNGHTSSVRIPLACVTVYYGYWFTYFEYENNFTHLIVFFIPHLFMGGYYGGPFFKWEVRSMLFHESSNIVSKLIRHSLHNFLKQYI